MFVSETYTTFLGFLAFPHLVHGGVKSCIVDPLTSRYSYGISIKNAPCFIFGVFFKKKKPLSFLFVGGSLVGVASIVVWTKRDI